ncbi:MAG: hypothetical protein EHM18_03170 [Acidobacteria bacterium]|nr:MAG: hypothetical protein EHM18_03170 [Acidobacteriota bacterium]
MLLRSVAAEKGRCSIFVDFRPDYVRHEQNQRGLGRGRNCGKSYFAFEPGYPRSNNRIAFDRGARRDRPPSTKPYSGEGVMACQDRPLVFVVCVSLALIVVVSSFPEAHAQWVRTGGPQGALIYALAVDPGAPETVYAGTLFSMFKTTDGGAHWAANPQAPPLLRLAMDPTNSQILHGAGRAEGVCRSTDGGLTWTRTTGDSYSIALDPADHLTIYAGHGSGAISKSTDGGSTWTWLVTGLPVTPVTGLAVDPTDSQVVYAGTQHQGVFKTINGGATWSPANAGFPATDPGRWVRQLIVDPASHLIVYAATDGGFYRSDNGGTTWTAMNIGLTNLDVRDIAIDPGAADTIFAATAGGGVFRSLNGGADWQATTSGLGVLAVNGLALNPANPQILYAGTEWGGVFKSVNSADTWSAVNTGIVGLPVSALALHPTDIATVYAGLGFGFQPVSGVPSLFRTTDSGNTWNPLTGGPSGVRINCIAIDNTNPALIFVGTEGNGVYRSTDAGMTWSAVSTGIVDLHIRSLAVDPTSPDVLYAGSEGVYKSTDRGLSWARSLFALTQYVEALAINPQDTQTVYAGTIIGVYRTSNGGASWEAANNGLINWSVTGLAMDPSNPATLYATTNPGGVWKTTNGGTDWTSIVSGLTAYDMLFIALDPTSPQTLYTIAAWGPTRVFRSIDGGANWTAFSTGLPSEVGWSELVLHSSNRMFVGTMEGVFAQLVAPTISSISAGAARSHQQITVSGSGFTGAVQVFINGVAAVVQVLNSNTLLVTVPNLPPGPATIEIVADGGTTTSGPGSFQLLEDDTVIPTMTEWGLLLLVAALLASGLLGLRKRSC